MSERGAEMRGLALRLHSFATNERLLNVSVEREYPETRASFTVTLGQVLPDQIKVSKYVESDDESRYGRWDTIYEGPADWIREANE